MTKSLRLFVASLFVVAGLACGSTESQEPDGGSAKGGDASFDLAASETSVAADTARDAGADQVVTIDAAGDAAGDSAVLAPDAGADAAGDAAVDATVATDATVDAGIQDAAGGGADAAPTNVELQGGTFFAGLRPTSTGSTAAPQVAKLVLTTGVPGQPLSGSFDFEDPQADVVELIVQVSGAAGYRVWTLTAGELTAKRIDLSKITLGPAFSSGTFLVYLAVRDKAGNVSSYLVGTLVIGTASAISVCSKNEPFQLMGKVPSASTTFYQQKNGDIPGYRTGSASGGALTIISQSRAFIDIGSCSKLLVSADSLGTKPLGWDNCLLVEYRAAPGADVTKRWYYCSYDNPSIFYMPTAQQLIQHKAPTVGGSTLDPPIPNGAGFGYQPKAIDLMEMVPAGAKTFELSLHVLDYGSWGSTTEIWALPQ